MPFAILGLGLNCRLVEPNSTECLRGSIMPFEQNGFGCRERMPPVNCKVPAASGMLLSFVFLPTAFGETENEAY